MNNEIKPNKNKLSSKRIAKGIGLLLTLTLVVLIANGISKASFQDISNQSDKIEIEYTTLKDQSSIFSEAHKGLEMKYDELPNNHIHFSEELQELDYERKRKNNATTEKHKGDTTMNSSRTNVTDKVDKPIPGYNDVELPHPGNPPGYNDDELTHPGCPTPGHIDVELDHPGSPNPGHIDVEPDHPGSPNPGHIDVELDHPGSPNPGHIDVELDHPGSPGDN